MSRFTTDIGWQLEEEWDWPTPPATIYDWETDVEWLTERHHVFI